MDTEEIAKISIERFAEQLGKPEAVLFWQYLDGNPSAKEMLIGLYQAGCDPLTLMTLAVLYCEGEELGVTETAKHATGYSVQQLASFSERLLQAAKDIQALNEAAMPGGVTLWKLIRVLGGGELLEKTLAPVLPSEQLDFEFTRLPVILAAFSVFLKSWPHPTYRALMADRNLGRKFFLAEFVVYVETILGHANWNAIGAVIAAVHFALGEPKGVSTETEPGRPSKNFRGKIPASTPTLKGGRKRRRVLAVATRHERAAGMLNVNSLQFDLIIFQ